MKKIVILVLVLVTVLLAAWVGTTWWFGTLAQRHYRELLSQVAQRGGATLSEESYQRGLFGATARTRVQIPLPRTAVGGAPLVFILEQRIKYGPFPFGAAGWRPVQAVIHSRIALGAATLRRARRLFPACPAELPLTGTTIVYLHGNGETEVTLPPLHKSLGTKNPLKIDWQGFDVRSVFSAGFKHIRGGGQAPSLTVSGREGTLHMAGFWADYDLDLPRGVGGLILGNTAYGLDSLQFSSAAGRSARKPVRLTVQGIKVQTASLASKGLINSSLRTEFARLSFDGRENGPGSLDLEVHNLDAAALETIQRLSRQAAERAVPPGPQALAAYPKVLSQLAAHSPSLEIRELHYRGADGQLSCTARVAIDGPRAAALHSLLQLPAALTARASLAVSEPLLRDIIGMLARQQLVAARRARHQPPLPHVLLDGYARTEADSQLHNLIARRFLVQDGNLLRLKVRYDHGKTVLNGRAMAPVAR